MIRLGLSLDEKQEEQQEQQEQEEQQEESENIIEEPTDNKMEELD